jgi:DNA-binding MarR family transcriptional regulator
MAVKFVFNNQLLGAWMLFHQTYNSISRCEDKEFGKWGISAQQHAILMAITRADGPVTPGQIARWVDRNANSITLMLDRMEKSGLVVRTRNVNDRRSLYVEITEKGVEVLKKGIEVGWSIIHHTWSPVS